MTNASDLSGKKQEPSFWDIAFEEARAAGQRSEIPVGAVVVLDGRMIGQAGNRTVELKDPTAHAEVLAIRMACERLGSERLPDADLYVTLEPCTMCAGTISFARIRRLYYAASDPKGGAVESGVRFFEARTCHHRTEAYGGFREAEASRMLKEFFAGKR